MKTIESANYWVYTSFIFINEANRVDNKSELKDNGQQYSVPSSFHQRFNIEIPLETAQRNFIKRILNELDANFPQLEDHGEDTYDYTLWTRINPHVANKLGKRYNRYSFVEYADTDNFLEFLKALEALYEAFEQEYNDHRPHMLKRIIVSALSSSEIDLGVQWRDGVFWPSGAKLLNEALVDDNLQWLAEPKYTNVLEPFKKGLEHLMEAQSRPDSLKDTVTEMYEALEALAKIALGNNRDLSGNREALINTLKLSEYYRRMLKDYIGYANDFRHPPGLGEKRVRLSPNEVEAFVYITGLFLRLMIRQLA